MSEGRHLQIVLDTNVLLVSVSSRSRYHWIFRALLAGEFDLLISNDILAEYEEILADKLSPEVSNNVARALLLLPNVRPTNVYFSWFVGVDVVSMTADSSPRPWR